MPMLVGMFKKRADLSHEEFRDYYENHHAPFNVEHFGAFMSGYTRSYVDHASPYLGIGEGAGAEAERMDVITRIEFIDDAAMEQMFSKAATQPGLGEAIVADEAMFMDRAASRLVIVSDQTSSFPTER